MSVCLESGSTCTGSPSLGPRDPSPMSRTRSMSSLPCSPLLGDHRETTIKKQTQHSARMWGSNGMSEVLHSWPTPKVTRSFSVPGDVRLRSPSVDTYLDFSRAPCDLDLAPASDAEPKGSRMPSKMSTMSCDSFMTASTTSNRSRLDSAASLLSGRSGHSTEPGPRADHLWRELSEGEPEEQRAARLAGPGQAIGGRGKASSGIPWRHLPSYDRNGLMAETGDRCSSPELKQDVAMTFRRCSTRFSNASSRAMLDCLAPVEEHVGRKPGAGRDAESHAAGSQKDEGGADPREAWLEVLKRRSDAKRESWMPQRKTGVRTAEEERTDTTPAAQHFKYKQQLKNPRAGTEAEIKDACPFHREDSKPEARAVAPATPQLRLSRSRGDSMLGAKVVEDAPRKSSDAILPERVAEARRDFAYAQERPPTEKTPEPNTSSPDASGLTSSSSLKALCRSGSARGLAPGNLFAMEPPVHSIRARGAATKPRWK